MTYRNEIETRARAAAEAARDEVLRAWLPTLENDLACCRDERSPDERQIDDMRRTIKWLRRVLKVPTPPGEKGRPSRPAVEEPEVVVEEPPEQHICWHQPGAWSERCRDNTDDLTIIFGCCRSGADGWFWTAQALEATGVVERHGDVVSAALALLQARLAVIDLAAGRPTVARLSNDRAAWALRKLSGDRPAERPKATDLLAVLKAAMVAAHPDRPGGSSAAFVEARQKYVAARPRVLAR